MGSFASYALSERMVEALKRLGYRVPTPIQEEVIPKVLRGESIIAKAETGSGKTHAFIVPIIDGIKPNGGLQAVIISPTRELARQTYDFARELTKEINGIRITLAVGGREIEAITSNNVPDILITTPGRLLKLADVSSINLYAVKTVVIDEADMLVDAGFIPLIDQYITKVNDCQLLAFSATYPKALEPFVKKFINPDFFIDQNEGFPTPNRVRHHLVDIHHRPLEEMVAAFIDAKQPYLTLVFASKIPQVQQIYDHLHKQGYKVGLIHGDLTMRQRNSMFRRIRANEFPIIIASDMAARGLDIPNITDIVSVDLPAQIEFYMHRAGRSGRYDAAGDSYLFYSGTAASELERLAPFSVKFDYLTLKDGQLLPVTPRTSRPKKPSDDQALERDIKKAIQKTKSTEVKPGYKKKVKIAVGKVKARHRRLAIKGKIRQQLNEQFKRSKGDNDKR